MSPVRRSVSPFGLQEAEVSPLAPLKQAFAALWAEPEGKLPKKFTAWTDMAYLPRWLEKVSAAGANDSPELAEVCRFLVTHRIELETNQLAEAVIAVMTDLFWNKTQLFLVTHYDKESCEKLGWPDESRDVVLFARERDILIGHFFAPFTDAAPGQFSTFINKWVETEDPDRILHFLDFCTGSKNPTFEHHLLFTHPALKRIVSKKDQLRALLAKVQPILTKLNASGWETSLHQTLGI